MDMDQLGVWHSLAEAQEVSGTGVCGAVIDTTTTVLDSVTVNGKFQFKNCFQRFNIS
jgi:hypothetical protein